ncbi:MAG: serine hydrolase, partial [Zymomonas sp.]|nr:serine hydrolase [Zymomonas sp.]
MLAGALIAAPLAAQQARAPAPYTLAIAAGYKALMTCSAMFIGGRSEAQIARDELHGIYTDYDAI